MNQTGEMEQGRLCRVVCHVDKRGRRGEGWGSGLSQDLLVTSPQKRGIMPVATVLLGSEDKGTQREVEFQEGRMAEGKPVVPYGNRRCRLAGQGVPNRTEGAVINRSGAC